MGLKYLPYLSLLSTLTVSLLFFGSMYAMNVEQRQRIEQGIRSLNARQVQAILQERNNTLTQLEFAQLWGMVTSLPQHEHHQLSGTYGENVNGAIKGTGMLAGLAFWFYVPIEPKDKKNIKNIFDKITHYVPKIGFYIFGTATTGAFLTGVYFLGMNLRSCSIAKRHTRAGNLFRQVNLK